MLFVSAGISKSACGVVLVAANHFVKDTVCSCHTTVKLVFWSLANTLRCVRQMLHCIAPPDMHSCFLWYQLLPAGGALQYPDWKTIMTNALMISYQLLAAGGCGATDGQGHPAQGRCCTALFIVNSCHFGFEC
jgi:hypothetical protein